jgi:hypothetical protein
MKTHIEDRPVSDEFEPIELGSVSEETKGVELGSLEGIDPGNSFQS